jgi:hypothetical protein
MMNPSIHFSIFDVHFLVGCKFPHFIYFYEFKEVISVIYFLPKVVESLDLNQNFVYFITQLQFSLYQSLFQFCLLTSFRFPKLYPFHLLFIKFSPFKDLQSRSFFSLINIWIKDFCVPDARKEKQLLSPMYYHIISHYRYLSY